MLSCRKSSASPVSTYVFLVQSLPGPPQPARVGQPAAPAPCVLAESGSAAMQLHAAPCYIMHAKVCGYTVKELLVPINQGQHVLLAVQIHLSLPGVPRQQLQQFGRSWGQRQRQRGRWHAWCCSMQHKICTEHPTFTLALLCLHTSRSHTLGVM